MTFEQSPFSIYIHWPFCQAKCPYCDFNSHVRQISDQNIWCEAYLKSLKYWKSKYAGKEIKSIFFGGGTPSLMSPKTVENILNQIAKLWSLSENIEITLEANPTSVEANQFKQYSNLGVNRLSLGIQALNDKDLKNLGRLHNTREALDAFDIARRFFNKISCDLIYGRQNQSIKSWETELEEALLMPSDHFSFYQLTIEKGTRFYELNKKNKLKGLPPDDKSVSFYQTTQDLCSQYGFLSYEISNYSKPNCESIHNLNYWNCGDYIGIGAGAHGRITQKKDRVSTETPLSPEVWLKKIQENQISQFPCKKISKTEQAQEYIMMSLRLINGLNKKALATISENSLNNNSLQALEQLGLIKQTDQSIKATEKGRLLLNHIIKELLL